MRTTGAPAVWLVRRVFRLTTEMAREQRAFKRAMKTMPRPVPWEWAAPRLMPFLSGPSFDPPGEPLVRARSDLGPMVEFGMDLGGAFSFVDVRVAERWERSPSQLMQRSLENLRARAGRIGLEQVCTGVMSGRGIRILRDRRRWATSLLLVPDELVRLFGDHDQVFGAPTSPILVSIPIDAPPHTIAEIVTDFESGALHPLWLGVFTYEGGELHWCDDAEDSDDDWTS